MPRLLTRQEVLRSLAWTAWDQPAARGKAAKDVVAGEVETGAARAGETASETRVCPPVAASVIADAILASPEPRRFRDMLLELAGDLRPVSSVDWLDLLVLVHNQLDGHDTAVARSRIVAQARVAQRTEILESYATDHRVVLALGGAKAVARRSVQEDGEARRAVEKVAREQGLTLADCDMRAVQRQLDLLLKLDALGEGAQRRHGRVLERIERRLLALAKLEAEGERDRERREQVEKQNQHDEERLAREREQQEELRRRWAREAQAHEDDRAWKQAKREHMRRRWTGETGAAPVRAAAPTPDDTMVEVLAPVPRAPQGDTTGGSDGG